MYYDHFGFQLPPFSISPDPRFLYLSERHRDALAHLIYGVGENGGFVLLTGQVGTGKTTLIRSLLSQELPDVDIALCLHSGLSVIDLVASILDELHIPYPPNPASLKPLVDALNAYLLEKHAEGRQTVLIIDEGQNLSREALEQIRLLTNLETDSQKLLRIILVGQEELNDIVNRPDLRQFSQRITGRYHLTSLTGKEIFEYIAHRIKTAKGNPSIFSTKAIREIYRQTQGIPRLINVLCDRALLVAYNSDSYRVTKKHVKIAAKETLPKAINGNSQSLFAKPAFAWSMLPLGIICLLGLVYGAHHYLGKISASEHLQVKTPLSEQQPADSTAQLPLKVDNAPTGQNIVASADKTAAKTVSDVAPDKDPISRNLAKDNNDVGEAVAEMLKTPEIQMAPTPQLNLKATLLTGVSHSQTDGVKQLLRLWGLSSDIPADKTACQFADKQQMTCSSVQAGGFPLLYTINRPALIEVAVEKQHHWLPVVDIKDENNLVCLIDREERSCRMAEIARYWTGNMLMLLRKPEVSVSISPGFKGEQIQWLRQRVALSEKRELSAVSNSLSYDDALVTKVKHFQKDRNLSVDGVIGDKTLLYLHNVVVDGKTPTLKAEDR